MSPDRPPLVGITTSELRDARSIHRTPQSEPPRRELALGMLYARAVEAAGGLPVVIPPLDPDDIQALLDRLDALCLSGGPDLDPATYGAAAHPKLGPTEPEVDAFELALTRAACERAMPILAICRGAQALNVARGGTLIQHLPDVEGLLDHRQRTPGNRPAHDVRVAENSLVARILGVEELAVNTFHHQAVADLGAGLRASAWAPDGVIEAIESDDGAFCLGVQWHAETMSAPQYDERLFSALVDAANQAPAASKRTTGLEPATSSLGSSRSTS